ncbi:ras-interacting protein RIP3 [Drosophila santomea]|uniref:ras-interacting protein RIP3 n=1 Tax=Drosophila santomea TaxID=129105 RepID=UPI001954C4EA|nr:ras-interacting protein RIP3 [Drosophila santomea]
MQRSYPLCHMVRPRLSGRLLGGGWIALRRTMASDSWGRGDGNSDSNSNSNSNSNWKTNSNTPRAGVPRASATSTVMSDAGAYSRGVNTSAFERRINREDNMWRDQSYIDTKWLNPRDPNAYRPNFRQTEPTSLRKQFMRSPDEISREVMGRDWEETVRTYKRNAKTIHVGMQPGGARNDNTRNRQQHLQMMHVQQQQEQQQQRNQKQHQQQQHQQQQHQQQQQQKRNQQQYNYWGRNVESSPKDQ